MPCWYWSYNYPINQLLYILQGGKWWWNNICDIQGRNNANVWFAYRFYSSFGLVKSISKSHIVGYQLYVSWTLFVTILYHRICIWLNARQAAGVGGLDVHLPAEGMSCVWHKPIKYSAHLFFVHAYRIIFQSLYSTPAPRIVTRPYGLWFRVQDIHPSLLSIWFCANAFCIPWPNTRIEMEFCRKINHKSKIVEYPCNSAMCFWNAPGHFISAVIIKLLHLTTMRAWFYVLIPHLWLNWHSKY